ncbi:NAD(P)-binding domain-containing protein [Dactylosporangium aurantiacum]|uniref:NAD(P)-binding domain-containing protein n=1 Tax=Dactylosporangium aurantiacum TaxID=35754 RepID=A0A9Q9IDM1_9ACTN|nr:NAD(P)-binding domain-containing protein [Dactylosporangium aurantiacum]MDG6107001.1 NAD(P)-binding domain-containing protein [Dactylosporangium aurantiacum]UWZ50640.1 NAD(P)-binding domain-containing protein [Dactylosporangium aurantiacum]
MRYVVIGCGNVGMELARRWSAAGHHVVGTTTSPARVAEVAGVCADVAVLRGSDEGAVRRAARGADAVVLTVSPRVGRAFDARDRVQEYADTLTASAATAARVHPRVVFTSSVSVYGAGTGALIDEDSPLTGDHDASPRNFIAAERAVLDASPGGAVVRIPDVYGHPRDLDYPARVRLAHELLGGSVPFAADALLYRIDYRDAAAALDLVVRAGLTGVYNAVPDAVVPPTNREVFGAICAGQGRPDLTYRAEIRTPVVPVSSARLRAEGWACTHSVAGPG